MYEMMEKEIDGNDVIEELEEVEIFHILNSHLSKNLQVLVPSTACIWVMVVYLMMGMVMFAKWEGWNYLDSLYFCVTSLLKVRYKFER